MIDGIRCRLVGVLGLCADMPHRFFLPLLSAPPPHRLVGPEAHHLAHVLRIRAGEEIEVFDGAGGVATAVVEAVTKQDVHLKLLATRWEPPRPYPLVLASAVPKGERCDWLVEKLTELGVNRWIPLSTVHSVVEPRDHKLDRLRQVVISACKQSGRNRLMEIAPLTPWKQFLSEAPTQEICYVADVDGLSWSTIVRVPPNPDQPTTFAIGPEGGWAQDELDATRQRGMPLVRLGPHILRIETAALTVAATWQVCFSPG